MTNLSPFESLPSPLFLRLNANLSRSDRARLAMVSKEMMGKIHLVSVTIFNELEGHITERNVKSCRAFFDQEKRFYHSLTNRLTIKDTDELDQLEKYEERICRIEKTLSDYELLKSHKMEAGIFKFY